MSTSEKPRRRPTIADVARLAKVDRALVSKVVNDVPGLRIKSETRQRIVDAVAELDYHPSRTARNLRLSTSGTIGLVVPELNNPVWAALTEAMEEQADEAGVSLLVATDRSDGTRVRTMMHLIDEQYLDGAIVGTPVSEDLVNRLASVNAVLVNQQYPYPSRSIAFDDARAVKIAVDELVRLGHTEIAHIAGPPTRDAIRRRAEAFDHTMKSHSLDPGPVVAGDLTALGGARRLDEVLSHQPDTTAIVVANVLSAVGALRRCAERGISVPNDMSLICIHDNDLAQMSYPALTSVRMPIRDLGRSAVRALLAPGAAPGPDSWPQVLGEGIELVRRESTAPPIIHPR